MSYLKKWREKNKLRYCWQTLKDNSKRRKIPFDITLEEFEQFCIKTDYLIGKGRTKDSYSIDRIDSSKGYTINNIQKLTVSENSQKARKILHYDWSNKEGYVTNNLKELNQDLTIYPF